MHSPGVHVVSRCALLGIVTAVGIVDVFAQAPDPSDQVVVCVGAGSDAIMRWSVSGKCPAGSSRVSIAGPAHQQEMKKLDPVNPSDPLGPPGNQKESQAISDLERRISNLEQSSTFEVVNKKGDVIFSVLPEMVQLFNQSNTPVALIQARSDGGQYFVQSSDGKLMAVTGAYGLRAGMRLLENSMPRLDVLKQNAGNYSLKVPSADGPIAGIGETTGGTGALVVGDKLGKTKATMRVVEGKGTFGIFNAKGVAILSLSESFNGGGLLAVGTSNGDAAVKFGTNYNRYGVVLTYPAGFPYVPRSGLPGSYFLGCAGGESCVP